MSNTNGLIASVDVCATGDPNSAYFIRKGEPIAVPSPLQIISPNGTKVGEITEDNNGVIGLSTEAQIQLAPGVDCDVVIETEPSVAGNELGLYITRTVPTNQFCSLHLDQNGALDVSPNQGLMRLKSQGGTRSLVTYCDPTGFVSVSNANDGADGRIFLNCANAGDSKVVLNVKPPTSSASGLSITNVTNASGQTATINAGVDGSLELSSSTNAVRVKADGSNNVGLIVAPADETTGNSALNIRNGTSSATPTNFVFYNASETGGGLTAGDLMLFSYEGASINRCLDVAPSGGAISIGDGGTVGGCVVNVNGTLGQSRVYDPLYNPPPAYQQIYTWTTSLATATDANTFTIDTTGLYMINAYIDFNTSLGGTATIPASGIFHWGLGYGDPAHSAVVVANANNQISAVSMTDGATWGYMSAQTIVTLQNNTYETPQRYRFRTFGSPGFANGTVTLTIYRLA